MPDHLSPDVAQLLHDACHGPPLAGRQARAALAVRMHAGGAPRGGALRRALWDLAPEGARLDWGGSGRIAAELLLCAPGLDEADVLQLWDWQGHHINVAVAAVTYPVATPARWDTMLQGIRQAAAYRAMPQHQQTRLEALLRHPPAIADVGRARAAFALVRRAESRTALELFLANAAPAAIRPAVRLLAAVQPTAAASTILAFPPERLAALRGPDLAALLGAPGLTPELRQALICALGAVGPTASGPSGARRRSR